MKIIKIFSLLFALLCGALSALFLGFLFMTEDPVPYCHLVGHIHAQPPADQTVYVRQNETYIEYAAETHIDARKFYTRAPGAAYALSAANWEVNDLLCKLNGRAYAYLGFVFTAAFVMAFLFVFPLALLALVFVQMLCGLAKRKDVV